MTEHSPAHLRGSGALQRPGLRKLGALLLHLVLAGLVSWLAYLILTCPLFVTPDGEGYLELAGSLGSWPDHLLHRTPGYPALLGVARLLAGEQLMVRYVHLLLFLSTIAVVTLVQRGIVPPTISLLCAIFALGSAWAFSVSVLTEWTSLCLLLQLHALLTRHLESPTRISAGTVCLIAAAIVLVRPILAPAAALATFVVLFTRRISPGIRAASLGLLAAPVVLWMGFNLQRTGQFAITPFDGVCRLTNLSLLIPLSCGGEAKEYAERFEERDPVRLTTSGERSVEIAYNHNMWQSGDGARRSLSLTLPDWNRVSALCFSELIDKNLSAYLRFAASQFMAQIDYLTPTDALLLAIIPTLLIAKLRDRTIPKSAFALPLIFVTIHLTHMAITVLHVHMIYRYFTLTFTALLYSLLISASTVLSRPR